MTAWAWSADAFRFEPTEIEGTLLVADSWLVVDGKSLSLDPHRERFTRSAHELGLPVPETDDFWTQLVSLVPPEGEWFPRVEFVAPSGSGDVLALVFRVRPVPPRQREMKLWIPPFPDPRKSPRIKGPDIPLLNELRQEAMDKHGCDDVLLYDEDGHVLETGTASLLWWDGDTLCAPDPSLPILPGTTSARILEEAKKRGVQVDQRLIPVDSIHSFDVWTANALHWIRRVVGWFPSDRTTGREARDPGTENLDPWRKWLEQQTSQLEALPPTEGPH